MIKTTGVIQKNSRKVAYPFSKIRVYFNATTGLLALLLSLTFLIGYSDAATTFFYLLLTLAATLLSLRLKLYLLRRMERTESDEVYVETEETRTSSLSWQLIATVALLALVILLPLISAFLISPVWWFLCFSSIVVGFSLSEPLLYLSTQH